MQVYFKIICNLGKHNYIFFEMLKYSYPGSHNAKHHGNKIEGHPDA